MKSPAKYHTGINSLCGLGAKGSTATSPGSTAVSMGANMPNIRDKAGKRHTGGKDGKERAAGLSPGVLLIPCPMSNYRWCRQGAQGVCSRSAAWAIQTEPGCASQRHDLNGNTHLVVPAALICQDPMAPGLVTRAPVIPSVRKSPRGLRDGQLAAALQKDR